MEDLKQCYHGNTSQGNQQIQCDPYQNSKGILFSETEKLILKFMCGLPWWLSGKESACQCRRHRFDPQSGKILHAMQQLSLCKTIDPVLQSLGAVATEPVHPTASAPQREKPPKRDARVLKLERSSSQLEKSPRSKGERQGGQETN